MRNRRIGTGELDRFAFLISGFLFLISRPRFWQRVRVRAWDDIPAAPAMNLTRDDLIEMHRRMLRIRRFEEEACRLLAAGAIQGAVHASIGQEATAVGACMALRRDDYIAGNHRSHGHPIAKGAALAPLMAELMGKKTGVCKGRGGSMHLADFSIGSLGESGIVGAGIALATGAGLSAQVRRTDQVAVCFFGDGASNTGVFHESLNMAAIWKLPVIYFCENNLYAATTPAASSNAVEDIADRAAGYGIPGTVVDGQDAVAVYDVVRAAVERARAGRGPSLIEAKTYRYLEHAEGFPIPGNYRTAEEIERWKQRDPIDIHRRRLIDDGILTEGHASEIETQVRRDLEQAIEYAQQSNLPAPADAFEGVYARSHIEVVADARARAESGGAAAAAVREIGWFSAVFEALREEMARDERVIFIGEDIALYASTPLLEGFADRLRSTPISENGFVGMAIGAAMTGLRPFVDLTVANFIYLAMDQIVNQAAKLRYMTGGQTSVPVVLRAGMWHNNSIAAQHSDRPYPMFLNVPGLKVVIPATPYDMKGLLKAAIRDDDPVLIFDELSQWFQTGPVPEGEYIIPLGVADVKREGRDVTVVAIGSTVQHALEGAEELAADGISVEVIDPRTLAPLDTRTILQSVAKTGRLVLVEPANKTLGAAAEIAAFVAEEAFSCLKGPVCRVTTPDVQIPFSPVMEKPLYPNREKIVAAVRRQLGGR
jgi:2-oxoisovalerate dehydrogenase E1 component